MSDRFRIPAHLPARLAEHRVSSPTVLRRAGLPAGFFDQDRVFATTDELFALWRAIGETSGDPVVGLRLGAEPRLERFNPTAIAAVCSRSFRDALERMARFKRLTCPEEIRVRTARGEASVEFVFTQADEDEPQVLVDLCLSWIHSIGRRGTDGAVRPLRAELARPVRERDAFERHFGCRVQFKADRNALVYRDADLDVPFVTHNVDLLTVVQERLETELKAQSAPRDVKTQVKHTLKRSLAGKRPTLPHVAEELCMSARTLQRRLTDAGVSFQAVVEETRRELARHYLGQGGVELNEAAYLLGYEDSNSFFRAFQAWEGTSPGQWRTRHGAAGAGGGI
jgi:AraC-like DNA-binding protein